ncbi:MAG TPA: biopolymer transporter ExbD [Myxococcota bacterium]|nr:biopolymer transporter ExbD [Myxococcota bacterium]
MGMSVGSGKGGPRSDINVTPLVDVCLVLLIIFMVVTPMLQQGKEVSLPVATNIDEGAEEEDPLILAVTADKRVWMGSTEIRLEDVAAVVRRTLAASPNRAVLLKGDTRLSMKQVREVMKHAQEGGATSVALGVETPTPSKSGAPSIKAGP